LIAETRTTRRAPFRYRYWIVFIAIGLVMGMLSYGGTFNGNVRVVDPNRVFEVVSWSDYGLWMC